MARDNARAILERIVGIKGKGEIADKFKSIVTSSAGGAVEQAIERASGRVMNPHKAVIYQWSRAI